MNIRAYCHLFQHLIQADFEFVLSMQTSLPIEITRNLANADVAMIRVRQVSHFVKILN